MTSPVSDAGMSGELSCPAYTEAQYQCAPTNLGATCPHPNELATLCGGPVTLGSEAAAHDCTAFPADTSGCAGFAPGRGSWILCCDPAPAPTTPPSYGITCVVPSGSYTACDNAAINRRDYAIGYPSGFCASNVNQLPVLSSLCPPGAPCTVITRHGDDGGVVTVVTELGICTGSDASVMDGSLDASIAAMDSSLDASMSDGQPNASPPLSFATDIVPILQANCSAGGASCHGDPGVVAGGAVTGGNRDYFGPMSGALSATQAMAVLGAIVGNASLENPKMNVVTAGDATKSFLMYKMDNTQDTLGAQCATGELGNCGLAMPYGATPIAQALRDKVRAWINQGAMTN